MTPTEQDKELETQIQKVIASCLRFYGDIQRDSQTCTSELMQLITANYTPNDVAKGEYRRGYANGYEAGSKYYLTNLPARKVRYECSICKSKMEELTK